MQNTSASMLMRTSQCEYTLHTYAPKIVFSKSISYRIMQFGKHIHAEF